MMMMLMMIFQRVMTVFVAFAMLLMGCELKFDVVRTIDIMMIMIMIIM